MGRKFAIRNHDGYLSVMIIHYRKNYLNEVFWEVDEKPWNSHQTIRGRVKVPEGFGIGNWIMIRSCSERGFTKKYLKCVKTYSKGFILEHRKTESEQWK